MKATTFGKATVGLAAALSLSLGCSTAFAANGGPTAQAEDPNTSGVTTTDSSVLIGVGSDTIQDVMYGIAHDLNTAAGKTVMQSWTATGGSTITYRSGLNVARPNGSGPGWNALTDSIGQTTAGKAKAGDVDFARASGAQGTTLASGTSGVITDIPFALDAMSFAVPSGSPFALTNSGHGLTIADLDAIYAGTDKYIGADGTLAATAAAAGSGAEPIWALLPKAGSGSREFFLKGLKANGAGLPTAIASNGKGNVDAWNAAPVAGAPYIGNTNLAGAAIQEHDATDIVGAPSGVAAIAPFSGAKFIGYHNGVIADPSGKTAGSDYTLVPFAADAATAGTLPFGPSAAAAADPTATLTPNTAYVTGATFTGGKFTREVYNVIATAAWKNPTANAKYALLAKTFAGATSDVCQDTATIQKYGFMLDTNCGATTTTYDTPSTATVTISGTPSTPGGNSTVTVNVQSNGNGGGKAVLTIAGASYTVTIPAGATSGTVTVPTPTAGTLAVTGTFTPNLAGVAPTQISGSITVAAPSITSVKISGKAKVGKTVKAVVVTVPAGEAVKYQWLVKTGKKFKAIKHATKSKLKLTSKFKGKKIEVKAVLGASSKISKAVKVK